MTQNSKLLKIRRLSIPRLSVILTLFGFAFTGLSFAPRLAGASPTSLPAVSVSIQSAFAAGNYSQVLKLLQEHPGNDAIYYYNLGTTLLKLNKVGQAVAYLEKANRLQPHDMSIQQNLRISRASLRQQLGPDRMDPASSWIETLADNLRLDEIRGALGLVGFVIALFWIRCYLKTRKLRETLLKPAGLLGIGALALTACLYSLERISGATPVAVCLDHVSIRSGPGDTYVEVAEAEAGEKLRALGPTATGVPGAQPTQTPSPTPSPSSSPLASLPAPGSAPVLWRQVRYSPDGIGWVPASDLLIL